MVDAEEADFGVVTREGETFTVRFERRIARPVEKVWAALILPERLADWIGEAEVEPRVGGRYVIRFRDPPDVMDAVITACDPPRLLEYRWPGDDPAGCIVRWELASDGDSCRLILTQDGLRPEHAAGITSGWHDFLEMLPAAADGVRAEYDVLRWQAFEALYRGRLAGLAEG